MKRHIPFHLRKLCKQDLHRISIESTINNSYGTRNEQRYITYKILGGSAKFFRLTKSPEWSLTNNVVTPLGKAAIGIGKKTQILFGYEKTGGYGVYTYSFTKFQGCFMRQVLCKIRDTGFCGSITSHARHRTKCRHGRDVDDTSLSLVSPWV